jgi:hypothetical protein
MTMYEGQKAASNNYPGGTIGQMNATPAATVSSSVDSMDRHLDSISNLVIRIRALADRLHGSEPRPVEGGGKPPSDKGPILSALRQRNERLEYSLNDLSTEIDRIDRAL